MTSKPFLPSVAAAAMWLVCFHGHVSLCHAKDGDDPQCHPDLSSPKSAALAWIDACWLGDAQAAHKILVDDEKQRKLMSGALQFSAALRKLELAAITRFGEAGRRVTGYSDGSAKAMEEKLEIQEKGDRAKALLKDASLPLELRRVDDQWRVDVSRLASDPRARRAGKASVAATKVAVEFAAEVGQGKYETADEAAAAFRERRLAAVKR